MAAALSIAFAGCQLAPSKQSQSAGGTATVTTATPRAEDAPAPIAWSNAGDCLAQLRLLHAAARQGRLDESHDPPFAVVQAAPATSLEWVEATPVPVIADLPLKVYADRTAAPAAARCLLVVEPVRDLRAAHRVVDFEEVASEYQSGVRSERNPEYDAAQARVREAERDGKRGGPGVLRVGDPMLDLVGLVVGGVISAFDGIGDDDLDDALAELKATPRSRDRPVYRAYLFTRSTVRAAKEAIIPIALRDLRTGGIWRTELRQREMRQFAVLEGLDPRDPEYEQQRAGALSRREFEHWRGQPPELPISAAVAALVEGDATAAPAGEPALVADAGSEIEESKSAARDPEIAALGPGAGPDGRGGAAAAAGPGRAPAKQAALRAARLPSKAARRPQVEPAAGSDPRIESVVRLRAGAREGNGLYVGPRLVATVADVVGTASVLDVITSGGEEVLGLVVLRDPSRNLAVVHVPRAGPAAPLAGVTAPGPGEATRVIEITAAGRARTIPAVLGGPPRAAAGLHATRLELQGDGPGPERGAPVFAGDEAVGLVASSAGGATASVIGIGEVAELLESEGLAALP